jgi:hypothetical protein
MLDGVDDIDWAALDRPCHDPGDDIPGIPRWLGSADIDTVQDALDAEIEFSMRDSCVYPTTVAMIPYLVEVATIAGTAGSRYREQIWRHTLVGPPTWSPIRRATDQKCSPPTRPSETLPTRRRAAGRNPRRTTSGLGLPRSLRLPSQNRRPMRREPPARRPEPPHRPDVRNPPPIPDGGRTTCPAAPGSRTRRRQNRCPRPQQPIPELLSRRPRQREHRRSPSHRERSPHASPARARFRPRTRRRGRRQTSAPPTPDRCAPRSSLPKNPP